MTPIGCHRQKDQPLAASNPFGVLSLRLVPMVTNDPNGKFYNGTIEKTPNATTVCVYKNRYGISETDS